MYFVIAQVLQLLVRYLERRADIMLGRRPGRAARSALETLGAAK
jgi:polar amino acid transport system permease protein